MDCREAQTLLTALHDGELPDADRARVENHLRGCSECGRLLADLARADEVAGVPDPGPGYWDRFNARLADRIDREAEGPRVALPRPKQGWMRQQFRYLVPAVAAAALVVVVVRYGGRAPVAPTPTRPPAESVTEQAALDSAGQRMAKSELEPPPAAGKTGDAAVSRRLPGELDRAAVAPTAPPRPIDKKRSPPGAVQERDEPVDRLRPEGKEMTSEDRAAAPAGIDAPYPTQPASPYRSATAASPPVTEGNGRPSRGQEGRNRMEEGAPATREPKPADEARAAPGARMEMEQHAAEAAMSVGKAREKAGPSALSPDAARTASPCETARKLASRERYREAEAAQRECLARDPSPPAQEKGLLFLAELLDRQARFAEADEILTEVHRQFPESLPLDLYRQQRPAVQKQQMPVPVTR